MTEKAIRLREIAEAIEGALADDETAREWAVAIRDVADALDRETNEQIDRTLALHAEVES